MMDEQKFKQVRSALISLFHKEPAKELILKLQENKVKIFSTGGTLDYIRSLGVEATSVEELTQYPSIFGGRVKTASQNFWWNPLPKGQFNRPCRTG